MTGAVMVCGECGERNPGTAQFCGACGAFLEWNDAAAPHPSAPATGTADVARPDEVRARRRMVVPDEPHPLAPGERPCPSCGTGNDGSRRFCRACGALLATAVAAPTREPVWRRWWRLFAPRTYRAGQRRRIRTGGGWTRPWLVFGLLVALVLVCALPGTRLVNRAVDAVNDRRSAHVPAAPVRTRASSSATGAGAQHVADGASNLFWAPAGTAVGAWVEVDFAGPVRLLDIIVTPGVSTDKQAFLTQGRPRELQVSVVDRGGRTTQTRLTLRDEPGGQRFPVTASDAVRVRFTVRSTYGMPPGRLCAVAELEFFVRG